ncbi:MAG: hypothetical protein L0226_07480 [Acidobacteria bacterium]|nr:hypothetical protein [Acidobacteriota bacterium]
MNIQWEYDLAERPFCRQLERIGWQWIEGDPDLPESTERASSREVLLKGRLAAALRKINLRDGQPWLDDERIARAIRDLEQAAGHRLMEVNQSATELLLKGTVADGLTDWEQGRPQPVRFIDFENPANNDFLVINQFKVELTSGRGHVIPDAVLFINGIPVVVAEFKSPGIRNPIQKRSISFFDIRTSGANCSPRFIQRTRASNGSSTPTNCSSPATSLRHARQPLGLRRRHIWSGQTPVRHRCQWWRKNLA